MEKYFENCRTADELRTEYRRLARELHPDRGGDTAEFQRMVKDYEERTAQLLQQAKTDRRSEEFAALSQLLLQLLRIRKPELYALIANTLRSPLGAQLLQYASPQVRQIVASLQF